MNFSKKIVLAALMSALSVHQVEAAGPGKPYSYVVNGADWPWNKETQCADTNQSPIDLNRNMQPEVEKDFDTKYENWKGATVLNKGLVVQVNYPGKLGDQGFKSEYAAKYLNPKTRTEEYQAAQFHFHAKSEHTIQGKRFDLEMHTVHLAKDYKSGVEHFASAMGLLFDVNDYDKSITDAERKVIDRFFDSLNFQKPIPTGKGMYDPATGKKELGDWQKGQDTEGDFNVLNRNVEVPYGDLMKIIDFSNRWVYSGSLTTPPCTTGVYHHVVDRILPIRKEHWDAYVAHQSTWLQTNIFNDKGEIDWTPKATLDTHGNFRIAQKIDKHNVRYLGGKGGKPAGGSGQGQGGQNDGQKMNIDMDGVNIDAKMQEPKFGGDQLTTEMKFDKYMLYGVDNVGGKGNGAPPCGPGDGNECNKIQGGKKSCCAHVILTDNGNGEQMSMYRCMNEHIMDMSYSMEIDDMRVSMKCSKTSSVYMAATFMGTVLSLITMALF